MQGGGTLCGTARAGTYEAIPCSPCSVVVASLAESNHPQEDAGSGHEENVGGSGQHVGREEGPHRHELRQDVSRSPLLLQQELAGQGTKATSLTVQVLLALVGEASGLAKDDIIAMGIVDCEGAGQLQDSRGSRDS